MERKLLETLAKSALSEYNRKAVNKKLKDEGM